MHGDYKKSPIENLDEGGKAIKEHQGKLYDLLGQPLVGGLVLLLCGLLRVPPDFVAA